MTDLGEGKLKKALIWVCLFAFVLCLTGIAAHAQDTSKMSLFAGYAYLNNNWGNGCIAACLLGGPSTQLHGYSASVAYNFNNHIGMEANFAGHNGSPTLFYTPATATLNGSTQTEAQDFYTYTFGPKITQPIGKFALFGHFLVGAAHGHESFTDTCLQSSGSGSTCSSPFTSSSHGNGFAFKTGAGADWNHGLWGIRILEVDYVHASTYVTETTSGSQQPTSFSISGNNFELSTGVTFHFGTR